MGSRLRHSQCSCFSLIFYFWGEEKKEKLKSMKAHLLDLNARLLLRANFSSFKQNRKKPSVKPQIPGIIYFFVIQLLICVTLSAAAAYSVWIQVCYVNWMSVCISLSLSFLHFLFLTRSGTVHILHNHMSPALSQWRYSQHLALYHDLHFSYVSTFSPQRHHWVPQHLFPTHGHMWAHTQIN